MAVRLEIRKNSITELDVDCIVNAANKDLLQGGGVCGAIFKKAGAVDLQKACNAYHGCPTGSAVLTPGFKLKARYVIHAVGPQWQGGTGREPQLLYQCYQSALQLAVDNKCHSIAFPLISAGIYGYPKQQAWEVAVQSITDFLNTHGEYDLHVVIAVLDEETMELGQSVLNNLREVPEVKIPHLSVCNMTANSSVDGFYILQSASLRTTASGKAFLSAAVSDNTGSVSVIFWDYAGPISSADEGRIVAVQGRVSEFKGALQITLDELRLKEADDPADLSSLVPSAPIDPDQMFSDILTLADSITDQDYRAICAEFLRRYARQLRTIPAAKSVHHSFLNGLLMHTGNMVKAADFLAGLYPRIIDRSLLIAGTLLHDFAKRDEFIFSELGLVTGYSVKGQLLGHLVMGAQDVAEIAKELNVPEQKSILLQHLLLAHHGKPEFGAAVVPMCAESDLLSMIDMMDSRMEIFRENLEQTPLGKFSNRIFALDGNRVFHHYCPDI